MEVSSPVRGQSSNSGVNQEVDSVIINNRLHVPECSDCWFLFGVNMILFD
jgi:hypothetical protein